MNIFEQFIKYSDGIIEDIRMLISAELNQGVQVNAIVNNKSNKDIGLRYFDFIIDNNKINRMQYTRFCLSIDFKNQDKIIYEPEPDKKEIFNFPEQEKELYTKIIESHNKNMQKIDKS